MKDYTELTYGSKPFTGYPLKLVGYLVNRYGMKPGNYIFDLGCGRGEYSKAFLSLGLKAYCWDHSQYILTIFPELFPYFKHPREFTSMMDFVFSKSLLEHCNDFEKVIIQMYDLLKPGGICIAMVPDYECCWKSFWSDFDHRKPFTRSSLEELFIWAGFVEVRCEKFLQSPPLWYSPWKKLFYKIGSYIWKDNIDMVFSQKKYTMLLCSGRRKPL